MTRMSRSLTAAAATLLLSSAGLTAQSGTVPANVSAVAGTDNVKAFIASRIAKGFVPPKTPWGDPDISGVFTKKDEANTPFERPDQWAGRRMGDITPKEFAEAVATRQVTALERAPRGVPIHWFDNLQARNKRPWFVIDPPEGKIPARVSGAPPEPPARRDVQIVGVQGSLVADTLGRDNAPRDVPQNRTWSDRCIVFGGLWMLPIIYGNSYQILQTPDYVVLRQEMIHEARMIRLDGRPLPNQAVRPYFGVSRGWWDGNTLVVETTNIHEGMEHRGASAKNLRLIERFTRTAPDQVDWSMTIDDPTVYTRPWDVFDSMTEDNTQLIYEYACHEGNYGMANLLSAGRAAGWPEMDRKAAPK